METIARIVIAAYDCLWPFLFLSAFLSAPLLILYIIGTLSELHGRDYDNRSYTPFISWHRYQAAFIYGILLPCVYFMCVRTKHGFGPFELGRETNRPWCIALGIACVGWLLYHLLVGLWRGRGWRVMPGKSNVAISGVAALLAWRYLLMTLDPLLASVIDQTQGNDIYQFLFMFGLPFSCFASATIVYSLAFYEALVRTRRKMPFKTPHPIAIHLARISTAAFLLVLFSPFILSLPRESSAATLGLIHKYRALINEIAADFRLDPKILGSIIYVARTRDHPRWTGAAIEELGLALWRQRSYGYFGFSGPDSNLAGDVLDPSVGLCQMRITTALRISRVGYYRGDVINSPNNTLIGNSEPSMRRHLDKLATEEEVGQYQYGISGSRDRPIDKPEMSLILASFYLHIIAQQWEEANSGWSIRERPEILATLYNIGIERSAPKANPQANDFGRRVLKIYNDPRLEAALQLDSGEARR